MDCPPASELFKLLKIYPPQSFLYYGECIVSNDAVPQEMVQKLETWLLERLTELGISVDSVRLDLIGPNTANFAIFADRVKDSDFLKIEGFRKCVDIDSNVGAL